MLMNLKVLEANDRHVRVAHFIGPELGSMQHAGELTFRPDEWEDYVAHLMVSCDEKHGGVDRGILVHIRTSGDLPGGRESQRGQLQFCYETSKQIQGGGFYTLLMAAMRLADTANIELLKKTYPDVWEELQERYNAPGGLLIGESNRDYTMTAEGLVPKVIPESVRPERMPWLTIEKGGGDYELFQPDGTHFAYAQTEKSGIEHAEREGYHVVREPSAKRLRERGITHIDPREYRHG